MTSQLRKAALISGLFFLSDRPDNKAEKNPYYMNVYFISAFLVLVGNDHATESPIYGRISQAILAVLMICRNSRRE